MDRTQQFLNLFNSLEQFLRESTDSRREVPFGSLIGRAATKNAAVRRHDDDLREFADLRNAIVHEHPRGHVIADITQEALDEFSAIVDQITAPKLVYPLFQREISVYREDDQLSRAVKDLWESGHSQVIVRVGKVLTLLSSAGITRWLGRQVDGKCIDLSDATVGDALAFEQEGGIAFHLTLCPGRRSARTVPLLSDPSPAALAGRDDHRAWAAERSAIGNCHRV